MGHYEIYITESCNMECKYCYMKNQKIFDFQETLKFVKNIQDEEFSLEFLGGEPLLYPERIEEICEILKDKKVKYIMTTNGTIMNDYIYDLIENNNIKVFFSIDGDYGVFNTNRPISVRGFDNIIKNFQDYNFNRVHITINDKTIKLLKNTIEFLASIGANYISIGFVTTETSISSYFLYSNIMLECLEMCINKKIIITPIMDYPITSIEVESNRINREINNKNYIKEDIERMLSKHYALLREKMEEI